MQLDNFIWELFCSEIFSYPFVFNSRIPIILEKGVMRKKSQKLTHKIYTFTHEAIWLENMFLDVVLQLDG